MSVSDPLGGVKASDSVSLDPMQIITVDDIEFEPYIDETGKVPPGAAMKFLMDPERINPAYKEEAGNAVAISRFDPNYVAPSHWHPSDTIYIIKSGEFHVQGEGCYLPGDFRWVQGGTAYGSEMAGPEGCEFYLISLGPFDVIMPEDQEPPNGYWHEILGAEEDA